ncbi:MAG: hypothetical protein JNJ83_21380 [Verrucomicrobiaceae bacterium]|nr:hypothetical protein [Verrucomicrobiaceae bacterium]
MKLFRVLAPLLCLASCAHHPGPPEMSEVAPRLINKTELAKTFALDADWRSDGWVIKKGSLISFNKDGTGLMEVTSYEDTTPPRRSRLHLFTYAFGRDGNGLFKLPNSDGGQVLHLHGTRKDCIHTVPFAFDARYFDSLSGLSFRAGRDVPLGLQTTPLPQK